MLKIRLKRIGRRHDPSYRLVVVESFRGPKSGQYIENLGSYNPKFPVNKSQVNAEQVKHWMSVGAKVSDTAHNLLISLGIIEGKKINNLPRKSPIKSETEEKAAAAEPAKKTEEVAA